MALIMLEAFDGPAAEPDHPRGPSEDWLDGHAAGLVEAQTALDAENARQAEALAQAIADLDFTLTEARAGILASLAPLFRALVEKVLPDLAPAMLRGQLVAELTTLAERDLDPPLSLSAHPDSIGPLATALASLPRAPTDLVPDPQLGPHEVILTARNGETALDAGRLVAEITELLDNLARPEAARTESEELRHG